MRADTLDTVLVIGEALIDIVEERGRRKEFVGGSPANTAIGVARQGHPARLLTRVGRDPRGERIAEHLAAEAVDLHDASWTPAPTSTAHARIEADGSARYTFELDWALAHIETGPVDLVCAGSIGLYMEPGRDEVLRLLRDLGTQALVALDPNVRPSLLHDRTDALGCFERAAAEADLVKLSDEDAEWLYPGRSVDAVLAHVRSLGPRIAVMTLGAAGARAVSDLDEAEIEALPVEVVDTIGAGDSFMATLISGLLERGVDEVAASLGPVLQRAACASAIAVSMAGPNPPHRAQLDEMLASLDC